MLLLRGYSAAVNGTCGMNETKRACEAAADSNAFISFGCYGSAAMHKGFTVDSGLRMMGPSRLLLEQGNDNVPTFCHKLSNSNKYDSGIVSALS